MIQWRERCVAQGLAGLEDDPRSGRPKTVDDAAILAMTLDPPPERLGVTHWSTRLLGAELKICDATVARAWRRYCVRPWRRGTFQFSTDPELVAKVRRASPRPDEARIHGRSLTSLGEEMDMSETPIEVFVATFGNEVQAGVALKDLREMDREGSIELIDAAVVVHDAEDKVRFEETADPSGKKWAKRGAIAGGLVGLIFPPSIIGGAIAGGAGGGLWGKIRDKGFKDEDLKAIGESLPPGTSAIIALAEDRVVQRLQTGLEGYEKINRHALSADAAAVILAEAEEAPA